MDQGQKAQSEAEYRQIGTRYRGLGLQVPDFPVGPKTLTSSENKRTASGLELSLEMLNSGVGKIEEAFCRLSDRLQPVMIQQEQTNAGETSKPELTSSKVASMIQGHAWRLHELADDMECVTRRLDL